MGIVSKLKHRYSKAQMTSGAVKAAEGRADLASLADKLDEMRGDNVSRSDPTIGEYKNPIEDTAKAAKHASNSKAMAKLNPTRYRSPK